MEGLPKTQRSVVKRACWSLGCGGAGFVSTLVVMHGPDAPAALAVGLVTAAAGHAIAELSAALPGIITALSAKKVARIKAKTDSEVALEQVRQRTALVNAGLEGKLEAALYLLKLHTLNAHVLAGRRLSEEMLRELLPDPRVPNDGESRQADAAPRLPRHAKQDAQLTPSQAIDS